MRTELESSCVTHNPQGNTVYGSSLEFQLDGNEPITRQWAVHWGLLVLLIIRETCKQFKKNLIFLKPDGSAGPSMESMNICLKFNPQEHRLGVNNTDCSINLLGLNPALLLGGLGQVIPTAPVSSLVNWDNSSISSRRRLCWSTKLKPEQCSQHCVWTTVSPRTG